ncbi:MAG TPA: amidase family protein [Methylomirabilota bacterium]|nr:amidase family protein [Methylomirabilota bacterium]
MASELWQWSACDLAAAIARKEVSCVEVMESVAMRIRAWNGELNAIVHDCTHEALAEACRADQDLAAGRPRGPLHGVPVTVKENVDQQGKPTPNGLPALADLIAPDDAPLVRNLRRAGAIIVGRTNTPELSMRATTDNPLHGRTRNPWHPEASAGGSSGGAGAAAAAGFGPIHHGNDIGGSLRFPAYACGLATVKPTPGRIPAYNPSATAERGLLAQLMSVQGAICREVRDVRLATRAMAAPDARDPWWAPVPFDGEPLPRPIRVAFTRNAHGYPIHPDIVRGLERVAGWLAGAGYTVEEVEPPPIVEPARAWFTVGIAEMKVMLYPIARQHGSATIQEIFDWYERIAKPVDAAGYMRGVAERTRMTRQWSLFLEQHPLVLTPFLMRPTFPWNYDAQGFAQTKDLFDAAVYSFGINYLGLPAGVVPIGLVDGLPAGVQIVGRRFREDLILDAMEVVEAQTGVLTRTLWAREG